MHEIGTNAGTAYKRGIGLWKNLGRLLLSARNGANWNRERPRSL